MFLWLCNGMVQRGFENGSSRKIAERVARRAGYRGWDPPESAEPPDPSELWDDAVKVFPRHIQKMLGTPEPEVDEGFGDVSVSMTGEAALSDDSGIDLIAKVWRGEDADEDGRFGYSGGHLDYTLSVDNKAWYGSKVTELKQDVREFAAYLETHDPTGYAAFMSK